LLFAPVGVCVSEGRDVMHKRTHDQTELNSNADLINGAPKDSHMTRHALTAGFAPNDFRICFFFFFFEPRLKRVALEKD